MQRVDDDSEGGSPPVSIRLPQKTTERLDELVANLPPHPVGGAQTRSMVLRGVIDAGIEAVAIRAGIKLGTTSKPSNAKRKSRASKSKRVAAR